MDGFVAALGLDGGYTLLVLNPKWSPSLPSYGYRLGFSEQELALLHSMVRTVRRRRPRTARRPQAAAALAALLCRAPGCS